MGRSCLSRTQHHCCVKLCMIQWNGHRKNSKFGARFICGAHWRSAYLVSFKYFQYISTPVKPLWQVGHWDVISTVWIYMWCRLTCVDIHVGTSYHAVEHTFFGSRGMGIAVCGEGHIPSKLSSGASPPSLNWQSPGPLASPFPPPPPSSPLELPAVHMYMIKFHHLSSQNWHLPLAAVGSSSTSCFRCTWFIIYGMKAIQSTP